MNLEFNSTTKSGINGLIGVSEKTDRPKIEQSGYDDRSPKFSELFDQSKQNIKQAERQLQAARQSRKDSQAVTENDATEEGLVSSVDLEAKVDEPKMEEAQADEVKDNTLLTLESAQLVMQNLQLGLEPGLSGFNLNLNADENGLATEPLVLTDMTSAEQELIGSQALLMIDEMVKAETPVSEAGLGMVEGGQNLQMEGPLGLDPELQKASSTTGLVNAAVVQEEIQQLQTDGEPDNQAVDLQNQQAVKDLGEVVTQVPEPETQKLSENLAEGEDFKSDGKSGKGSLEMPVGVVAAERDSNGKTADLQVSGVDKTTDTMLQTENQNSGEKGTQEINLSGINQTKGTEVQPDKQVDVVKQVEQKILQNFEPNKPMVIQMTLSPENLGEIEVQLKYDQGKLVIDILAASRETQNLLGKQINLLVKGLALQNVQVESVRLNVPVEQSSESQDSSSMMNSGSDPNQNQNETQLRESFIKHSRVMGNLISSTDDDETVVIPQNLQNYTGHRVNYLI